jgi:hypothetical protein
MRVTSWRGHTRLLSQLFGVSVFLTAPVSSAADCATSFDESCLPTPHNEDAIEAEYPQQQRAAAELALAQCPAVIQGLNFQLQQVEEEGAFRKAQALASLDTSGFAVENLPPGLSVEEIPPLHARNTGARRKANRGGHHGAGA